MSILVLFLTTLLANHVAADRNTKLTHIASFCSNPKNSSSEYENNRIAVLSELQRQATMYPFYNASQGLGTTKVYGQYYCRGDIGTKLCSLCIQEATQYLVSNCSFAESGINCYEECTLRYDNRSMTNVVDSGGSCSWSEFNVSDPDKFSNVLGDTLNRLINESAYGNNFLRFSTWEGRISESHIVYCEMQCSPYFNGTQCETCLRSQYEILVEDERCGGLHSVSSIIFYPNCQMMYKIVNDTDFQINPPISSPSSQPMGIPPPPTKGMPLNKHKSVAVFIAPPLVLLLLLSIVGFWVYKMKRKNVFSDKMDEIKTAESLQFDISTIRTATNHFSDASKLGEGGFGSVYKGRLQNGQEIAVKRLYQKAQKQGVEEFKNEVLFVAKLQHRNLVKLLGYCLTGREKLLIFELLPNLSLDNFLKDETKRAGLDWNTRYKIILGVARGLLYLHEESRLKVIHRDLKPNNILLDENMNPKIADFGQAKSFNLDQSIDNTHNIVGTYGYMSPEYAMTGHFSAKSDVYSFGVIVLEIITGKRNIIQENEPGLFHHAWKQWTEGNALDIVDPTLLNNYSPEEAMTCIHIGLLCIQEEPGTRPSMAKVVSNLNGQFTALPEPSPPLIFTFTEDGSGFKYSSALITQTQEQHMRDQSFNSAHFQ